MIVSGENELAKYSLGWPTGFFCWAQLAVFSLNEISSWPSRYAEVTVGWRRHGRDAQQGEPEPAQRKALQLRGQEEQGRRSDGTKSSASRASESSRNPAQRAQHSSQPEQDFAVRDVGREPREAPGRVRAAGHEQPFRVVTSHAMSASWRQGTFGHRRRRRRRRSRRRRRRRPAATHAGTTHATGQCWVHERKEDYEPRQRKGNATGRNLFHGRGRGRSEAGGRFREGKEDRADEKLQRE